MKKIIPQSADTHMLILIGIFIISLSILQPWVRGDGIHYYAYIRSLVIDGDLRFENEFKDAVEFNKFSPPVLRGIKEYKPTRSIGVAETLLPLTKTGYTSNQAPVGAPLLWSPFFLLAHLLVIILNRVGIGIPADGYSFPYIFLVSFGSCLYGFIGLILGYKICRRYFSDAVSLYATVSIWWASSMPAYMHGHPLLSHTSSVFAVALLLFFYLKTREGESLAEWTMLGLIAGLAMIVRIQDGLFLLIPVAELLRQYYSAIKYRMTSGVLKIVSKNILFLTGFLLGILPQLIVGKVIYGVYTLDFYRATQKEFAFNWFSPPIFQVLFSSWHGLFSWTPILFFAMIGLYCFFKKDKAFSVILSVIFLLQLYVISGSYSKITGVYLWQYSSFGGRMFLSCTPIFILGLAGLTEALKVKFKVRWSSLILLMLGPILWNLAFIFQFGLGLVPREGYISWKEMAYNQFITIPFLVYQKIFHQNLLWVIVFSLIVFCVSVVYLRKRR